MLNTKEIALVVTFAALTISLDPLRVPSLILPGVYFRFCEIPIVIAFLLFGFRIGIFIAALNVIAEIILFPGPTVFIGRPMIFLLVLFMFSGIFLAHKVFRVKLDSGSYTKTATLYTAFGAALRAAAAPFLNFLLYRYGFPFFGINITETAIMALVPGFIAYAVIFALYTIPIGFLIAKIISSSLKITPRY